MSKILLVEDDQNLGTNLSRFLTDEGIKVSLATNLKEARDLFSGKKDGADQEKYQLIILDWMLPDGQGIDFLREVRQVSQHLPIIMLTARTELIDKVIGLESGANDYMTKPFEPRELIARIRAQMRGHSALPKESAKQMVTEVIERGDLKIDHTTREVYFQGKKIEMTKMEYDFLKLLAEYPNRAFSREEILNKVWGYENYPSTRTVDTHVLQIRQKLRDELIETVRGIGYRFRYEG